MEITATGLNAAVSTHSRPKAAGPGTSQPGDTQTFQLTAARRRLAEIGLCGFVNRMFQLTAARRRLAVQYIILYIAPHVSTHSRPKAAGKRLAGTRL